MKAIELLGDIDEKHRTAGRGSSRGSRRPGAIVLLPDEDEGGTAWPQGIAREWSEELRDSRQDVYTLEDGQAVDAPR